MTRSAVAGVVLCAAGLVSAQDRVPAVPPAEVRLPSSCSPEAQPHLDRGLVLLHAFALDDALAAFIEAAAADEGCALAYWGQALSWVDLLGEPPPIAALEMGLTATQRARVAGAPTDRERAYVDTAAALFEDYPRHSHASRLARFREAAASLREVAPHDAEALVLEALAVLAQAGAREDNARRVADLIERSFGAAPEHLGAAHVLMIAWERQGDPGRALEAADRFASVATDLPQALHLPSHVWERAGLWERVAEANEAAWMASVRASDSALRPGRRDYHSLQWWLHGLLQQGAYLQARELLAGLDDDTPADIRIDLAARLVLEARAWTEAVALADPGGTPLASAMVWFVRGYAAARLGRPDGNPAALVTAREAAARLDELAGVMGRRGRIEMWRLAVLAGIAAAQEEREEMLLLLLHALAIEEAIRLVDAHNLPLLPMPEVAAELWLQVDRYRDARELFAGVLERHSRRPRALIGLARAASALGDREAARAAYTELLDVWRSADPDRPELAEAREALRND